MRVATRSERKLMSLSNGARYLAACALALMAYAPSANAQETDPTTQLCLTCCLACCCGVTPTTTQGATVASRDYGEKLFDTAQYLWDQDELRSHDGRAPKAEMPMMTLTQIDKRREKTAAIVPKRTAVPTTF